MAEDVLRYDLMIESALREVVRQTLEKVVRSGLPGEHHFYISFLTKHPGVDIPDHLRKRYPDEMTIVLQYQFFGLTVTPEGFSVILSFNGVREKLTVPFAAITTFADPSVNFALQFQSIVPEEETGVDGAESSGERDSSSEEDKAKTSLEEKRGEVISLDSFRKNK